MWRRFPRVTLRYHRRAQPSECPLLPLAEHRDTHRVPLHHSDHLGIVPRLQRLNYALLRNLRDYSVFHTVYSLHRNNYILCKISYHCLSILRCLPVVVSCWCCFSARGNVKKKRLPSPSMPVESTQIWPPMFSTRRRQL